MLRPRRRLVLEGEGDTVEVAKPGGVGDTGCENISLRRPQAVSSKLFFFFGGASFSGDGAAVACCK
jgi:hypothetical protein